MIFLFIQFVYSFNYKALCTYFLLMNFLFAKYVFPRNIFMFFFWFYEYIKNFKRTNLKPLQPHKNKCTIVVVVYFFNFLFYNQLVFNGS